MTQSRLWISACLVAATLHLPTTSNAGLYWQAGVRSKAITLCFVGDATTTRSARVDQIRTYLSEFEYAANVRFQYLGKCPAPTTSGGKDNYDGDIRVVIPNTSVSGTGPIPGNGCTAFMKDGVYNKDNDGWGSWSNTPQDLIPNRSCMYNLKLGDDPWNDTPYLNHTLHEFGHALGLSHEHVRNDANVSACIEKYPQFTTQKDCENAKHVWNGYCMNGYGVGTSAGYITSYDRYSVMHYAYPLCGIEGNYGRSGLSPKDQLSVHILYPEDNFVAEFVGTTVIPATRALSLVSAWQVRGGDMNFAAKEFSWRLQGTEVSANPSANTQLAPGNYVLQLKHKDFLDRNYSYTGPVRVLDKATYNRFAAGIMSAQSTILH